MESSSKKRKTSSHKTKAKPAGKAKSKKRTYDRVSSTLNPRAYGSELKLVEWNGNYVASSAGEISLINGIAQGNNINTRNGNRVELKTARIRMMPEYNPSYTGTNSNPGAVRVLFIYDRSNNGLVPNATDVFGRCVNGGVISYTEADWLQGISQPNRERFVILADEIFAFNAAVFVGTAPNKIGASNNELPGAVTKYGMSPCIERFIKLKNLQALYKSATATTGDIVSGALWMVLLTDQSSLVGNGSPYVVHMNVRLVFGDQ